MIRKSTSANGKPKLTIAPDDENFTDEDVAAAVARLREDFEVDVYRYSRKSAGLHAALVMIDMAKSVLVALPPNIIASALYDALKCLFLKPEGSQPTTFVFELEQSGDRRRIHAVITTSSDDHLLLGLTTIQNVALNGLPDDHYVFTDDNPSWTEA